MITYVIGAIVCFVLIVLIIALREESHSGWDEE